MANARNDPDQRRPRDLQPADSPGATLEDEAAEAESLDPVTDPGELGGVDAPNEGIEEPETEP